MHMEEQDPKASCKPEENEVKSEDLLVAVSRIKQARDRDSRATDDGGSSGRSDTNDGNVF